MRFKIFENFFSDYENHNTQKTLNCRISELEEKYNGLLEDVKRLEEENIETSNVLYQLMNSIQAVDDRIDILIPNIREENGQV